MHGMPFLEYITIFFDNNKFIFTLMCFIISKIGSYNLLPFISVLIGYFIVFYTILDYAKLKKISSYKSIFMILVFIGIFYFINFFSGVAQFLGISIAFLAFYLEFIKDKKKIGYKIVYIIPMFIHSSLIVIPILRFLLSLNIKKLKKYIYIVLIVLFISPTLIQVLISLFQDNFIIGTLLSKANMYLVDNFRTWEFDYGKFDIALIIFYIGIYFLTIKEVKQRTGNKIFELIPIILFTLMAFIQYFDIFTRFTNIAILFMNIYILQLFTIKKNRNIIISLGLIILTISGLYINIKVWNTNDFHNITENMEKSIFYYLK